MMSESNDLRAVQVWLGIPQIELAVWLGVSRERVAQAETGQRALPFAAWPRLTQLTLCRDTQPVEPPETLVFSATYTGLLQARVQECYYQVARLTQELRSLQARAQPLTNRLAALPRLLDSLPEHDPRRCWLSRLADEATDELKANVGVLPQTLLLARIAAYQHEATLLEAAVATTDGV